MKVWRRYMSPHTNAIHFCYIFFRHRTMFSTCPNKCLLKSKPKCFRYFPIEKENSKIEEKRIMYLRINSQSLITTMIVKNLCHQKIKGANTLPIHNMSIPIVWIRQVLTLIMNWSSLIETCLLEHGYTFCSVHPFYPIFAVFRDDFLRLNIFTEINFVDDAK